MITVQNPQNPNEAIDIYLSSHKNTKINVNLVNNTPFIKIKAYLEGHVTSSDNGNNYSSEETLADLNSTASNYLNNQITSYLYKTSKDFKSDINGFGKYAINKYITWEEWLNSNWLDNYQNAFFDVEVAVNIKSGELFSKM